MSRDKHRGVRRRLALTAALAGKARKPKFDHQRQRQRDIATLVEQGVLTVMRDGSRMSRHTRLVVTDAGHLLVDATCPEIDANPPRNMYERARLSRTDEPEPSTNTPVSSRRVLVDGERLDIFKSGPHPHMVPHRYCVTSFKTKSRVFYTIPDTHRSHFAPSREHTGIVAGTLRASGSGWVMDRRLAYVVAKNDYGDNVAAALARFDGPLHSMDVYLGKTCRHVLLFPRTESQEFGICLLLADAVILTQVEQLLP